MVIVNQARYLGVSAAKQTAIVVNVNKCTKTTSGSQWHCVT